MRKSIVLLFVVIVLFIAGCGTRIHLYSREEFLNKVNLIENSGFENADSQNDGLPEGWIVLNNYSSKVVIDNSISHSGEKSLKINKPDPNLKLTSDSFEVDPSCSYYCHCFIKTNSACTEPVMFYFFTFDNGSKQVNRYSKKVYPTSEWTEVEITTDNMHENAMFGRIVLTIPKESDINLWVDDMESFTICDPEQ